MESNSCSTCHKPKATLKCGLCAENICKYCAQFLDEESFSFLPKIPSDLAHSVYCNPCFESKVAGPISEYNQMVAQAKEILIYEKSQGKETRLVRRLEDPVKVVNCPDKDETLLRLAFLAALGGHNALVDVDVRSEKVKNGSYQTTNWSGSGIPVQLQQEHLIKDRSNWHYPN